jgi:hypothetical protein
MRSRVLQRLLWVAVLGALLAGVLGGAWWWSERRASERQLVFVIPAGTAARQAAGEEVVIFPATITIDRATHDTLVIRNEDTQTVQIGPYRIAPGQRFTQRFFNRGTYELLCTVHTGEQLRIVVV